MKDDSRLAVLEKTAEIQEDRINALDTSLSTLATEFRVAIDKLTGQLADMNNTLANMKGFWAGIAFTMSILGAGLLIILEKVINKFWP